MTTPQAADEARTRIREMIKSIATCMFVTTDEDGRMRSRPMYAQSLEDGRDVVWFFTKAGSPKNDEIGHDGRVLLAFARPDRNEYVSIRGTAEVVRDVETQKALWSAMIRVWFPQGPESEEVSLIRVELEGAEYWDSPASAVVFAYGYAKAVLTGRPPKGGDNEKTRFNAA
jgi:general stress protein 26